MIKLNALLLEMIERVLSDQNGEELPEDSRSLYIYDTIDSFINSTRTPCLPGRGSTGWHTSWAGTAPFLMTSWK